jgi:hypothetical protein
MVDREAEKAASLLATYKYNDDVKEIRKTDSKIYAYYYHLDRADYNLYKAKYDVYIGKNANPEKLIVSLQFERSDSDYYTSGRIELEGTEVYAVSSCDVAKSFEQQLERAYPVKSSIKDSMAIKKLQEAQKNGEKSTFKSLFKMFDR